MIGVSLPSISRPYVHSGVVPGIVLWNTRDLGYLTVYAGWLDAQGKMPPGATSVVAGRLGRLDIQGSQVILGSPFIFDKSNIDRFDF